MTTNPFGTLSSDCGHSRTPVIPVNQDCTQYRQLDSEVGGLIIVPRGASEPTDWTNRAEWVALINNDATGATKYVSAIASFQYQSPRVASLAGGRLQVVTERKYRLTATVTNMHVGHQALLRIIEKGRLDFKLWLETVENRLIGGRSGLVPDFSDGGMNFQPGAKEAIIITADFTLQYFPATTIIAGTVNPDNTQISAWGNPSTDEVWGNTGTGWGWVQ